MTELTNFFSDGLCQGAGAATDEFAIYTGGFIGDDQDSEETMKSSFAWVLE